jgi:hypothetical protein
LIKSIESTERDQVVFTSTSEIGETRNNPRTFSGYEIANWRAVHDPIDTPKKLEGGKFRAS